MPHSLNACARLATLSKSLVSQPGVPGCRTSRLRGSLTSVPLCTHGSSQLFHEPRRVRTLSSGCQIGLSRPGQQWKHLHNGVLLQILTWFWFIKEHQGRNNYQVPACIERVEQVRIHKGVI